MFRGLGDLLSLFRMLPMWAVVLLSIALMLLLGPMYYRKTQNRKLAGIVRKMVRAKAEKRKELSDSALALADYDSFRLETLIREAIRYNQNRLRDEGYARLLKVDPVAARPIRELFKKSHPSFRDPLEAVVVIETQLSNKTFVKAREHLAFALKRYPEHSELLALKQQIEDEAQAAESERRAAKAAPSQHSSK